MHWPSQLHPSFLPDAHTFPLIGLTLIHCQAIQFEPGQHTGIERAKDTSIDRPV